MKLIVCFCFPILLAACFVNIDTSAHTKTVADAAKSAQTLADFRKIVEAEEFICSPVELCDEYCRSYGEYDFPSEAEQDLLDTVDQKILCWWNREEGLLPIYSEQIRAIALSSDGRLVLQEVSDKYLGP